MEINYDRVFLQLLLLEILLFLLVPLLLLSLYSGVRMIRKDVHICPEHFGLPERYLMNVGRYSVRPGALWERVRRLSPSINFCPRYIYILKLQIVICVLNCRSLIYACPFRLRGWMGRKYLPIKYLGRSYMPIKYLENNSVNQLSDEK